MSRTRICYHCHSAPANPRSNFCAECAQGGRLLWHPPERPSKRIPPFTLLLLAGSFATTAWLIWKTVTP